MQYGFQFVDVRNHPYAIVSVDKGIAEEIRRIHFLSQAPGLKGSG